MTTDRCFFVMTNSSGKEYYYFIQFNDIHRIHQEKNTKKKSMKNNEKSIISIHI